MGGAGEGAVAEMRPAATMGQRGCKLGAQCWGRGCCSRRECCTCGTWPIAECCLVTNTHSCVLYNMGKMRCQIKFN